MSALAQTPAAAWPYPRWIAHRGAGRLAPENTLAAFRCGAAHGYGMFECDVKLSADGVAFLLHDATLDRTTDGHGTAGAQPWSALAQLDAGGWHSRAYAGEPIPTFQNVAHACLANGWLLDVEIKPTPGTEAATGRAVATACDRYWRGAAVAPFLTSFAPAALAAAREAAPALPHGLLLDTLREGWVQEAQALGCAAAVLNHALWDTATVAAARGAGLRCLSYTVNDPWAAERLIALGTDGIVTDRVDLFAPGA